LPEKLPAVCVYSFHSSILSGKRGGPSRVCQAVTTEFTRSRGTDFSQSTARKKRK
jgi:hypothetical protein